MGYSNLFSHVLKQHPDYVTTLANSGFNSGTLVVFIDQKSQTVYCWLDFVTDFHSDHYVAVFAVFEHDQRSEKVILALAPIADDGVEDQTAESHVAFLAGIQPFFKRDISSIIYLVGDNCSVNTRLADLLQVSFIGCASHRLNLVVNVYLSDYEPLLDQMQQLMRSCED
ncbi:hypothetical protein PF001_g16806 [Phytophthora fragariae]|uniref:Uncharacterized protein n=1 Tax=Phytophthora fragariae TaxID=53985 RepID=A0A6A4CZK5_9STRA|nr:hypothetical protein PF001_g16806 [Phytophthora fragariae]